MQDRGVYVRETFPGVTELRAVDGAGATIRQLTIPTALYADSDIAEMWRALDRISPSCALTLLRG